MNIEDLKQDKRNYRKHNDRNISLIRKSVDDCGLGRSIVIDKNNEIVAGNGLVSAISKNTPVRVIETDGSELVVVKRTDLDTNDEKRKKLAIMDNSTSDSSEFDIELMQMDFDNVQLEDMGVDVEEVVGNIVGEEESRYTRKITIPIYEIKGKKPKIDDMINKDKADGLIKEIEDSDISEKDKEFLKLTATRLYEFKYDNIAEYYAHSDKKTQELMEKLALVIIDFDKAIENGYLELNKIIEKQYLKEEGLER